LKFCWQSVSGNYLATVGNDNVVRVWDRHGQRIEEFQLSGSCTMMKWDSDGDILSCISEKSSHLFLWDSTQKKVTKVDSGAKDAHSVLAWSGREAVLVIGTAKGNCILYNHKLGRKVPILGKHSKRITTGCWSAKSNLFGLGGDDKLITISDANGKTTQQFHVSDQPSLLVFSEMKGNSKSMAVENTMSVVLGRKTLFVYKFGDPDGPSQLAFQPKYGKIESYSWYGDNYIMIGFSHGHLVSISTHPDEIGKEIFHVRNHHDYLSSLAINPALNSAATCGDSSVHIHDDMSKLEEIGAIITPEHEKGLKDIQWTSDGQLLAISTAKGRLHCYLTKLPMLADTYGTRVAYLTSLLEVTVFNSVEGESARVKNVSVEPTFVACGPDHISVGMNNRAWFYRVAPGDFTEDEMGTTKEYLGTIESMSMNLTHAAVMFDGKLQLHQIEAPNYEQMSNGDTQRLRQEKLFPPDGAEDHITCCTLTNDFLVYGTQNGNVVYFLLEDWSEVECYKHASSIKQVHMNDCGSHVAFIDHNNEGVIYNPVDGLVLTIPDMVSNARGLLWETNLIDRDVFAVFDEEHIYTYVLHRESLQGAHIKLAGKTRLPFNQKPLLLNNGVVTLQLGSGKATSLLLDSHSFLQMDETGNTVVYDEGCLAKAVALKRWNECWDCCVDISKQQCWELLGEAALRSLDVEFAVRVYRQLQDAGMVLGLQKLRDVEDRNLVAGTIASYMGDFDQSQALLLKSSNPAAALELRRDLMHWDTALQLAGKLDRSQIPFIAREYAQQLEFTGNYVLANQNYEKGLTNEDEGHDDVCLAGLARTLIRLGNIRKGLDIALKHPNQNLKKECAAILEQMRQFLESASLYEKSGNYDKAAAVYIRAKNWNKVGELLPKVTSLKIHLQYAKAKEQDRKYLEACDAYHRANEYDHEVRVCLDHLKDAERAVRVVKASGSSEGAKMVANFFIKLGDYGSGIQFLVLSGCNVEAFHTAKLHSQMEVYAEIVGDQATDEDFLSIALHFESENNHLMAGKFFLKCGKYHKALKHLLRCGETEDEEEVIHLSVQAVAAAQDVQLTRQLSDYLLGENDDLPKDPNYLFKMYMALGQYGEAAQTAIIISKEEQNNGNYRKAHDLLFSMLRELKERQIKVPMEMETNLMILHSYLIVKHHVKGGNHLTAARLLVRVAENISKFPNHIVNILTSTVVECHKSKLLQSSFGYAAMVLRPEYRSLIMPGIRRKIENIVRKREMRDAADTDDETSPCPFCQFEVADFQLVCPSCRNNIPYCVATGRHISTKEAVTRCPMCQFLAFYKPFQDHVSAADGSCPMCSTRVTPDQLLKVKNLRQLLQDGL